MDDSSGVDFDRPNVARMYDFMLGGAHNFAVDRELVAQVMAANPDIARSSRANRAFLARVVQWCTDRGIDQFLDLGSGVPTTGNVHEIAHRSNDAARIAYVDFEPVAVAHAEQLLDGLPTVSVTRADLREVPTILNAPGVAGLLDFHRPVAVLALAVLHFVPGDLAPIVATYRDVLAPGSVLAISHGSHDHDDPGLAARTAATAAAYAHSATPATTRSRAELRALFAGFDLVAPGLVDVIDWPHHRGDPVGMYGGVGVLP